MSLKLPAASSWSFNICRIQNDVNDTEKVFCGVYDDEFKMKSGSY
jgi:hypothetical protein